jgi:signal transduction histidine kinase
VYALGAYLPGWAAAVGSTVVILAIWAVPTIGPTPVPVYSFAISGPALGLAVFAILGAAARHGRLAQAESVRQAYRAAEAELARRLAEERLRIARELHDVLAHTVSIIAVHAGVALDSLDDDPAAARESLVLVRTAARQAGPELRAAVSPLRSSTVDNAAVALPAPQLAGVPELLLPVRAAGVQAEVVLEPGPEPLPHPVELTAYRIVQEALTNVVRHARAARVDVEVVRSGDHLRVLVQDDGHAHNPGNPSGLGIVGMRERAELLGGEVEAGPGPDGGFRVLARLPVQPR